MYLDKHDILKLKKELDHSIIEESFVDSIYLVYRDEEGEINVAYGEEEIEDAISSD